MRSIHLFGFVFHQNVAPKSLLAPAPAGTARSCSQSRFGALDADTLYRSGLGASSNYMVSSSSLATVIVVIHLAMHPLCQA